MATRLIKNPFWASLSLLLVVMVLVGVALVRQYAVPTTIDGAALDVIERCRDESYRPTCYDREIPKLMGDMTLEEVFAVAREIQVKDKEYPYCHVLGHELGALEARKDPEKWKEVAARCPTDSCSNGCMHGVFQERFRRESLPHAAIPEIIDLLAGICEAKGQWNVTPLSRGTCTHALGHLTMYVTNADIEKSLAVCEGISPQSQTEDLRPLCYDGVFMQLFQPLEPDDFALVEGKAPGAQSDVAQFCAPYEGEVFNSCVSESWPLSSAQLAESPLRVREFCDALPDQHSKSACRTDLFYILAVQFNLDDERMHTFCKGGERALYGECAATYVMRLVEVDVRNGDRALAFCERTEGDARDACYNKLAFVASFALRRDSQEFTHLCEQIPAEYRGACVGGGKYPTDTP